MPKRALTDAAVKRLKLPDSGQMDVFDSGFPGLALRLSYGGRRTFVYFYRHGGKLRRMTLGTFPAISLAEAREAWRGAREDVAKGRDPAIARKREKPATIFRNVAEEWLRRDQAGNRSHDEVKRILDRDVIPHWGTLPVTDIGRRDVLDLIDGIADRGAVVMARRVHAHLHRFFKWSVGRGIIETNPMADLPKTGTETKRDRVLNDKELVAVWRAAESLGWPFGPAIQLLILTGARREEVGALRWSEIEDMQICLSGERTKNGESRTIPLSIPAVSILGKAFRITGSEFIFTTTGTSSVSGWSRAKRQLDSEIQLTKPWRLHDVRRSVSTGMNELGVEPHVVEAVLGHKIGGVAGVYNRAKYEAAKKVALEAWGAHVLALVENQKPGKVLPLRGKR